MFYLIQQCNKITTNGVLVPYLKSLLFAEALFQCAYLLRSISRTFAWLYYCSDDHKREHLLYGSRIVVNVAFEYSPSRRATKFPGGTDFVRKVFTK
jgi:hypothetical protein